MGISIDMFVKSYKANSKAKDKTFEEFIQRHITTKYVPYLIKYTNCTDIVQKTTHIKEGNKEIIKVNSAMQCIFFWMKLIELYTDIEFNKEKVIEEYDKLKEIGAVEILLANIPPAEIDEMTNLLGMKMDDFRENEYSLHALLYNIKESFSISEEVINSVIEEIKNKIEIPE